MHGRSRTEFIQLLAMMLIAAPLAGQAKRPPAAPVVTGVVVNVSIGAYRGPCPARLIFTAKIAAATVPKGPVTYQWIRSDGVKEPRKTLVMKETTATITDKWSVGRAGEQMRLWKKLSIISPNPVTSSQADVSVLCN